jgi:putative transposase
VTLVEKEPQPYIDGDKELSEIPSSQKRPVARKLEEYLSKHNHRNEAIVTVYISGGYTLKETGV